MGRVGSKAKGALAELAELRKSGQKRADVYEVKEEEAVYDIVDETKYAEIVQKRRDAGGFVVDPDGLGYADIGEEEDWGAAEGEPAPAAAVPSKRKAAAPPPVAPPMRLQRMMQAAAARQAVPRVGAAREPEEPAPVVPAPASVVTLPAPPAPLADDADAMEGVQEAEPAKAEIGPESRPELALVAEPSFSLL
ncbi:hypothetical protein H632_c2178p0, partial [Helicosporidium sp. ATCC 50920]